MNELLIVAVVAAAIALWLAAMVRGWRASARAKRRAVRAGAGEDRAAGMLETAGYHIVERQARTAWVPLVDGEPCELELRADYIVEADGELLVAEVKTGEDAPSITTATTRRQLLEYWIAFEVDGVLLVCPERDAIHRIEFGAGGTLLARRAAYRDEQIPNRAARRAAYRDEQIPNRAARRAGGRIA